MDRQVKSKIGEEFLQAINEVEPILSALQFHKLKTIQSGVIYSTVFKREMTRVEFLFGPPEFQIEMLIYLADRKFEFKDLLEVNSIASWVKQHRYEQGNGRILKNEIFWYVELLKFSLSQLEQIH